MPETDKPTTAANFTWNDVLKSWTIAILTIVFVILYILSLFNVIPMPAGVRDLQAIVFVIIGYYFGRVPAEQNENSLKKEIDRQATRADAAVNMKDSIVKERNTLEEKTKNMLKLLENGMPGTGAESRNSESTTIKTAIDMLRS